MSLENAPKHIQLAVDLIQLLEENNLDIETVLSALTIVQQDFERKKNRKHQHKACDHDG